MKIEFEYKDVEYCLEYNRLAIKFIEEKGFDLNKFTAKPLTMIEIAFVGAFYKNHKNIKGDLVQEIFDNIKNKQELAEALITMINETYDSLIENDEENENSKKIEWKKA